MHKRLLASVSLGILMALVALFAQSSDINYDVVVADRNFRDGIIRFHQGQYGEAVLLFQQAMQVRSSDTQLRTWLGRAYYHAGFEEAALTEWSLVERSGGAGPALVSFMEYLRARQGLGSAMEEDFGYFPVHEVKNDAALPYFRRPSSVLPLPSGSSIVASFATNGMAVVDANGKVIQNLRGGLQRYQGPFDLCLVDGSRLFVSQFLSDQIFELGLDGSVKRQWGSSGIGNGQFKGPQYLAWDGAGYLYVSDVGNRRVQKFDLEGNHILSIGERSRVFDGMERPTGLVWMDSRLYVLDQRKKDLPRIYVFDESGNALDWFEDERLAGAEGMWAQGKGAILLPAGPRILQVQLADFSIRTLHESSRPRTRYTRAAGDQNGNILASDFDTDRVDVLARLAGAYAGLHVQVQRVHADKFPEVRVELTVSDNFGKPVVGLGPGNFALSEGLRRLPEARLVAAGFRNTQVDAMVVVESSLQLGQSFNQEALRNLFRDFYAEMGADTRIGLVTAGTEPVLELPLGSSLKQVNDLLPGLSPDMDWAFDRGLRLAVPELIKSQGLKNLVYVSFGPLPDSAFANYGLAETLAYLRNNRIRFSVVNLSQTALDPSLEYLMKETGGAMTELYQPKGLAGFGRTFRESPDGSYSFTYSSGFDSDFGRKYLPLEVEVRLFQKSGRDESGYFAPGQT